jgi:hypothetical protein
MTVADADAVLAEIPGVRGFQIDQAATGEIRVRICRSPLAGTDVLRTVEKTLERAYDFSVLAEAVPALEHELSGKVRLARRTSRQGEER